LLGRSAAFSSAIAAVSPLRPASAAAAQAGAVAQSEDLEDNRSGFRLGMSEKLTNRDDALQTVGNSVF
jgi:hypothetical protein